MNLHPAEAAFYFLAQAQIAPELRPVFVERVVATLGAHPVCELGPGDVDRAVRRAFAAMWVPLLDETRTFPQALRRSRETAKDAPWLEVRRRTKPGFGYVPA
jgi:hypothetical protein